MHYYIDIAQNSIQYPDTSDIKTYLIVRMIMLEVEIYNSGNFFFKSPAINGTYRLVGTDLIFVTLIPISLREVVLRSDLCKAKFILNLLC